MGDVDQSEADKLDPDLWNQNDDNEKELTEGSQGLIFNILIQVRKISRVILFFFSIIV